MGDSTVKPDSGNDLVLSNNGGTGKIEINDGAEINVTLGSSAGDDLNVGSGKFVVEGDTGNVGIGIDSPLGTLDIDASSKDAVADLDDPNDYAIIIRNNSTTGAGNGIAFTNDSATNVGGAILHIDKGSNNLGDLAFYTNSGSSGNPAERMRISSSGNVGIGTDDPDTKVHIAGTDATSAGLMIEDTNATANQRRFRIYSSSQKVHFDQPNDAYSSATDIMAFDLSNQYVGIGTTVPDAKLTLSIPSYDASTTNGQIRFQNSNNDHDCCIQAYLVTGDGSELIIGSNAYVNTSGGYSRFDTSAETSSINLRRDGTIYFLTNGTGGNPTLRMTIDASGNIGAPSGTNIYNASDVRLKKNVTNLSGSLEKINQMQGVSFNWIDGFCSSENKKTHYGLIAQDLKNVDSNLVSEFGLPTEARDAVVDDDGNVIEEAVKASPHILRVNDQEIETPLRIEEKYIIPILVEAIKELSVKVSALENV